MLLRGASIRHGPRLALLALVLAGGGARAQERAAGGLNVLLTNDDGYDAPGLTTMRQALLDAGHRVTVVAPLDDRAGSSAGVTMSGLVDYYQQSMGVWAIDGTPADAVTLALVHIMRDDPPDLVVSGTNFGQSAGAGVVHSGTVGAAITASRLGVPAIAVSVAHDFAEENAAPPYPSTTAALEPAARFAIELIRQLGETDAQGLLPARTALNVNYPAIGAAEATGVRFVAVASVRPFRQVYTVAGETGPARVETTASDVARAEQGSDVDLLGKGYVTISVLDGSYDAGPASWEPLLARLAIER